MLKVLCLYSVVGLDLGSVQYVAEHCEAGAIQSERRHVVGRDRSHILDNYRRILVPVIGEFYVVAVN